jgi:hypothetical protein
MIAVFASAGLAEVVAERGAGSRRRLELHLAGSGGVCGTGDEPFGVQETTELDGTLHSTPRSHMPTALDDSVSSMLD